jgi:aspartate/methionine/tyrosine aminotransferase
LLKKKAVYLLLDETYREMSFTKPLPVAATLSPRVISVSSMSKSYGLPGIRIGWLVTQDKNLMETFLAAKEQIFITNSVVDEEIALQFLSRKDSLFPQIKKTIEENFALLKQFLTQQHVLEWIEPGGGCVCFPRIKPTVNVDTKKFHDLLLTRYGTYVGPGHWFEEDDRNMRIGFGWERKDKLEKGLNNILKAIEDARY